MNGRISEALVLAGHGSTQNQESSLPTRCHAQEILRRGLFAEVQTAFWLEEPRFKDVLAGIHSPLIYLVPNFICEGFYTREILPREFQLEGAITERDGKRICYCDPVGLHPSMTDLLMERAAEVLLREQVELRATCLFIAGHGTPRNPNSTREVYRQVETLRAMKIFGQVEAAFMEEPPLIKDWPNFTALPNVIMVPFFIADGLHPAEDIPVMLGITDDAKRRPYQNPTEIHGRRLWYTRSIGTEPGMVEVILAQVEKFRKDHGLSLQSSEAGCG
ncbi:MAG: cobalamin biosynthesis protein CbiX [Blastochloris sp.]|nr:cobalamin biosynthesis protein CbiX [Blastochloris sp.]